LALACALVLAGARPAVAGELEQRQQLRQRAAQLYHGERFAELDRLFDQARTGRLRTDSGVWQLWVLHRGLIEGEPRPGNEQQAKAQVDRARRWLAQRPDSVEAPLVVAEVELNYAHALACHQCTVVSEDQRTGLVLAAAKRAQSLLEEAKARGAVDPQWYADMLDLGQLKHWGPEYFDEVLDEATAKSPDYYTIWFEAVDYLLEQPDAAQRIDALAREAVAKTRAREGGSLYARIWWYAAQVRYGDALFTSTPIKWEDFDAGIRDVMKRHPDDWNRNSFANFACNAGKKARARELMAGHEPMPEAWDSFELYAECVGAPTIGT
jgi:hypothetical protein